MKKRSLLSAAFAFTALTGVPMLIGGQASAAVIPVSVSSGTAHFGNTVGNGAFSDSFTFSLSLPSFGSSSLITISLGSLKDIDFSSVDLNGDPFTGSVSTVGGDELEVFTLNMPNLPAGSYSLNVNGTASNGPASYAGTLNITPIPEPASWALMMGGFALVGSAIRRRRSVARMITA